MARQTTDVRVVAAGLDERGIAPRPARQALSWRWDEKLERYFWQELKKAYGDSN
jgi:hypothetical protein